MKGRSDVALVALALASGCTKDRPGKVPLERASTHAASVLAVPAAQPAACGPHALPPDQHFVAEGLCARVVAYHRGHLRGILFAPNGDLVAVTTDGEIQRFRDVDHDGVFAPSAPESITWARTGGHNGHDCRLSDDELYCGSERGVRRWRWRPDVADGGPGEDVVVAMPDHTGHTTHPVLVDGDALYVVSGSATNVPDPMPKQYETDRAVVRRFSLSKVKPGKPLAWGDGELVTRGVRNLTAIAKTPAGRVVGVDQNIDDVKWRGRDVHQDNGAAPLVVVAPGKAYGWPFCFFAQHVTDGDRVVPPGTPLRAQARGAKSPYDDAWCKAHVDAPITLVQAHSSVLSMQFVTPGAPLALPARYARGAFLALHGSWDRSPSTGYKVVWLPTDDGGAAPMPSTAGDATRFPYETVFGGGRYGAPRDGRWSWKLGDAGEDPVRPVGVAISPVDGALYVSSDNATGDTGGAIYRVSLPGR